VEIRQIASSEGSPIKVHRATVHKLVRCRELPGLRIGWRFKFRQSSIDAWIRESQKDLDDA
jgi:excisionase family DNA binding protein